MLRRWTTPQPRGSDHFIAISSTVQERIRHIYGRESVVIHPPVNTLRFTPDPSAPVGDYYLIVSRLIPYKRIDLAVKAFQALPHERFDRRRQRTRPVGRSRRSRTERHFPRLAARRTSA